MKFLAAVLSISLFALLGCSNQPTTAAPRRPSSENAELALLKEATTEILKNSKKAKVFAFTGAQKKTDSKAQAVKDYASWLSADKKSVKFKIYDVIYDDQENVTCILGGDLTVAQIEAKAAKDADIPLKILCYVWFDEKAENKEVTGISNFTIYSYSNETSYGSLNLEPKSKFSQTYNLDNSILNND